MTANNLFGFTGNKSSAAAIRADPVKAEAAPGGYAGPVCTQHRSLFCTGRWVLLAHLLEGFLSCLVNKILSLTTRWKPKQDSLCCWWVF